MKEKIITVYEIPESVEGDPYIRVPAEIDKDIKTIRPDRETGENITLWEEKLRYPYKTRVNSTLFVKTSERTYKFMIRLDEDGSYCWNGSNLIWILWTLLKINQNSPCGLQASKWHDNILQYKQYFLYAAREFNPDLTKWEFLYLTTNIYKQLLINNGVGKIKAFIMGLFLNGYQRFFNRDWNKVI